MLLIIMQFFIGENEENTRGRGETTRGKGRATIEEEEELLEEEGQLLEQHLILILLMLRMV